MIEGRTKSGFEYSIEEDNIDQELLDALAEADDGNPLKISKVIRLMLGDEQRKRLYGFYPVGLSGICKIELYHVG